MISVMENVLVFLKKCGRWTPMTIFYASPLMYIFKALRPYALIRFGEIPSRFGHLCSEMDTYLTLRTTRPHESARVLDLFCLPTWSSNEVLEHLLTRNIKLYPRFFIVPFLLLLNIDEKWSVHRALLVPHGSFEGQFNQVIHQHPSPVTKSMIQSGSLEKLFKEKNPENREIIVLALRDSAYTSTTPELWHLDESAHRNFQPAQVASLISCFANTNYFVVRGGSAAIPLEEIKSNNFFDYANSNERSAGSDLELFSKANLCLGTDTGLTSLALLLRKPVYLLGTASFMNKLSSPLIRLVHYHDFIDSTNGASLTLRELEKRQFLTATGREHFEQAEVKIRPLENQEIEQFVKELLEMEKGIWRPSACTKTFKGKFLKYLERFGFQTNSQFNFPNFWTKNSVWFQ